MQSKQYILHSLLWESACDLHGTKKLSFRRGFSHGGHLLSSSSGPPAPWSKNENTFINQNTCKSSKPRKGKKTRRNHHFDQMEISECSIEEQPKRTQIVKELSTMILLLLGLISRTVVSWFSIASLNNQENKHTLLLSVQCVEFQRDGGRCVPVQRQSLVREREEREREEREFS